MFSQPHIQYTLRAINIRHSCQRYAVSRLRHGTHKQTSQRSNLTTGVLCTQTQDIPAARIQYPDIDTNIKANKPTSQTHNWYTLYPNPRHSCRTHAVSRLRNRISKQTTQRRNLILDVLCTRIIRRSYSRHTASRLGENA